MICAPKARHHPRHTKRLGPVDGRDAVAVATVWVSSMMNEQLYNLQGDIFIMRRKPKKRRPRIPVDTRASRILAQNLSQAVHVAVVREIPHVLRQRSEEVHHLSVKEVRRVAKRSAVVVLLDRVDLGAALDERPRRVHRVRPRRVIQRVRVFVIGDIR